MSKPFLLPDDLNQERDRAELTAICQRMGALRRAAVAAASAETRAAFGLRAGETHASDRYRDRRDR